MKTLRYNPSGSCFDAVIIVDKIVKLSKNDDGEITNIHLINGEVIRSHDSINTIEARLNSED